jgi:hypothetical protein
MSIRQVAATTSMTWDNSTIAVPAGTIMDVQPRSALETALGGAGNVPVLSAAALTANVTGSDPAATSNS